MAYYYVTDEALTDELPADLTDTAIATEGQRTTKLRGPASRWIDAVLPQLGGFGDVGGASPPPEVIQEAAKAYALYLANRTLNNGANTESATFYLDHAKELVQLNPQTGRGRLILLGDWVAIGVADRKRDRQQEAIDNQEVVV